MSPLKWASVPARFSVSRIRGSTLRASPSVQPRHRPLPAVSDAWPAPCVSVYAIPLVLRTRRLPRHLRGRFNGFRVNLNQVPQLPIFRTAESGKPTVVTARP